ncbi:MAG TPA: peptide ABC transporter substrate-binding protein [Firmicutes bacterium]|nr:peptide ABC transporter substrate-binding protein [Bacillota bacterium]
MNKKLLLAVAACGVVVGGCSNTADDNTGTNTDNQGTDEEVVYRNPYNYIFSSDPVTLDYVYSYQAIDNEHTTNFVDGLLEHDRYGNLVGALATDYTVNDDATVFTFNIREGVKWVTDEGVEYADVTAHDFVTGLRHAAEFDSQTLYLVQYTIKNLDKYVNGEVSWEEVGVKAVDDYTLEYTLEKSTPYFHTISTYAILMPVNQEFLESKGDGCKLGAADAETCEFGKVQPDGILYNGAYLLKNFTSKSVIEYEANPSYWDAEHVYVPSVKLVYYDGSDPDSIFTAFDNGEFSAAPVYTDNAAFYATAKEKYGDNIYVSRTTSTTFWISWILDRNQYTSPADPNTDVSTQTDKQKADTALAKQNKSFRQAVLRAIDTATGNAQYVGEDLKENRLRNMLTQPDFVLKSDGTLYGTLVSNALTEINSDLYPSGFDTSDGHAAYFNVDQAKTLMEQAKAELEAEGVEFPVQLDVIANGESEKGVKFAQAVIKSIEDSIGEYVDVNIILSDSTNMDTMKAPNQVNSDLYINAGWGPDYGDPKTYVDILDPDSGDMLKYFGLDWTGSEVGDDAAVKEAIGLYEFQALKDAADAVVDDNDKRFELYAKAEAYLLDNAYFLPSITQGGGYAVSKVIPYTVPYAAYGLSDAKYKGMQVSDEVITSAERDALKAEWEANLGK